MPEFSYLYSMLRDGWRVPGREPSLMHGFCCMAPQRTEATFISGARMGGVYSPPTSTLRKSRAPKRVCRQRYLFEQVANEVRSRASDVRGERRLRDATERTGFARLDRRLCQPTRLIANPLARS